MASPQENGRPKKAGNRRRGKSAILMASLYKLTRRGYQTSETTDKNKPF